MFNLLKTDFLEYYTFKALQMMNPKPTKIERLREFQACPLHGILRGVDCIFTAGCRFAANVWKYRNQRDPITGYTLSKA
jgi:hypothetical protein